MTECKICKSEIESDTKNCEICQYPIGGTEKEQATYVAKQVIQKSVVEQSIDRLKKSRTLLFILGGFYIVAPFTPLIPTQSILGLSISIFLGFIFVGFGLLTFKRPIIALLIPLSLTIFYYLTLFLINPFLLFYGMLWKVIVLTVLAYGYFSVRKSDIILKNNPYLASKLGFRKIMNN